MTRISHRIPVLLAACLFGAGLGAVQAAAASDPVAVVKTLYARDVLAEPALLDELFSDRPAEGLKPNAGGESNVGFAFWINGQDICEDYAKGQAFSVSEQNASAATVTARLDNCALQEIVYSLVAEGDRWVIDEVRSARGEVWTLSDLLKGAGGN